MWRARATCSAPARRRCPPTSRSALPPSPTGGPPRAWARRKIKKDGKAPAAIALVENPDILASLSKGKRRPKLVIGFAAETHDLEAHAKAKLGRKGCDWIVANDVSVEGTMGGDQNAVAIVSAGGIERWERMAKSQVATKLAQRIAQEGN